MLDACYKVNYLTAAHGLKFVSCVRLDDKILGYGIGERKKDSETRAAMDAIQNPYSFQFFNAQLRLKYKDQMPQDYENGKQLDCVVSSHPNVPSDFLEVLSEALAKEEAGLPVQSTPKTVIEGGGDSIAKNMLFYLADGRNMTAKRVMLDAAEINMNSKTEVYAMFNKKGVKPVYNTMVVQSGEFLTELVYSDEKRNVMKVLSYGLDDKRQLSQQKAAQLYLHLIHKKKHGEEEEDDK
ncbi:unnamed protein product [Ambrosiozyma monospora]|uniref:Unnamed protein product n=1 Tax=Ambrosiozyma monospora TaxID=43982 RepID=A0A9W6YZZ1_AMBMO|nr:unnamed protein product [Ambrosiozyma monospora]